MICLKSVQYLLWRVLLPKSNWFYNNLIYLFCFIAARRDNHFVLRSAHNVAKLNQSWSSSHMSRGLYSQLAVIKADRAMNTFFTSLMTTKRELFMQSTAIIHSTRYKYLSVLLRCQFWNCCDCNRQTELL